MEGRGGFSLLPLFQLSFILQEFSRIYPFFLPFLPQHSPSFPFPTAIDFARIHPSNLRDIFDFIINLLNYFRFVNIVINIRSLEMPTKFYNLKFIFYKKLRMLFINRDEKFSSNAGLDLVNQVLGVFKTQAGFQGLAKFLSPVHKLFLKRRTFDKKKMNNRLIR